MKEKAKTENLKEKTEPPKDFIERISANKLLIIAVVFVLLAPMTLVLLPALIDFSESGQIGDTIGGITAPAIGLLGAILVYKSFKEQVNANKELTKQLQLSQQQVEIAQQQITNSHKEGNFVYLSNELDKVRMGTLEYIEKHHLYNIESEQFKDMGFYVKHFISIENRKIFPFTLAEGEFEEFVTNLRGQELILQRAGRFIDELNALPVLPAHYTILTNKICLLYEDISDTSFNVFDMDQKDIKANYGDSDQISIISRSIQQCIWHYDRLRIHYNQWSLEGERKASGFYDEQKNEDYR